MISVNLLNKPGLQKEENKSEPLSFIKSDNNIIDSAPELVLSKPRFNSFLFILILVGIFILISISYYLKIL
tara:strand:+ start:733 stop:945 length:213 start_codon:yes stop_codon:yes gene_type:complete